MQRSGPREATGGLTWVDGTVGTFGVGFCADRPPLSTTGAMPIHVIVQVLVPRAVVDDQCTVDRSTGWARRCRVHAH